jgi:hypothetical protein
VEKANVFPTEKTARQTSNNLAARRFCSILEVLQNVFVLFFKTHRHASVVIFSFDYTSGYMDWQDNGGKMI